MQNLGKLFESQIKATDEFLIEHEKKEFKTINPLIKERLSCESFKSLDKTDLFDYLLKFNKKEYSIAIEDLNHINSYISVVRYLQQSLMQMHTDYKNGASIHATNFAKNFQTLLKTFDYYSSEFNNSNFSDDEYEEKYKPILELFKKYIEPCLQNGNCDAIKLKELFFIPLEEILTNQRDDIKVHSLRESVFNCMFDINGIINEKGYLTTKLRNNNNKLKERKEELKEMYEQIEIQF